MARAIGHDEMIGPGGVRGSVARWVFQGSLTLTSAGHLGGEGDSVADLTVLRDPVDGSPLLTGSSLAGALRSHLNDRQAGYFGAETTALAATVFGGEWGDDQGAQSPLIVFDSRGCLPEADTEIRDGVRIDAARGTASDGAKFDLEVLPAGTRFPLRFEFLVESEEQEAVQLPALGAALLDLERGEIALGARRSRGFGRVKVSGWRAHRFDLTAAEGWLD